MSATKVTLAFLCGAAAGGAAALFLAPAQGEETRRKLRRGYDAGASKVEGAVHSMEDKARGYSTQTRDKLQDVAGSFQHRKEAWKEAFAEGKQAYRRELGKEALNEAATLPGEPADPDFV